MGIYNKVVFAGNNGKKVRSDCFISMELTKNGGIEIFLKSKVKAIFGKSIVKLIKDGCNFFSIENVRIDILDKGALVHVLMARFEACVRQLMKTDLEFLPDFLEENSYSIGKDNFRFSRLYLPGNTPSMMLNAGIHKPNGIILDLEDSVAITKKEEARLLIRNSLRAVNFYGAERMVRINQGERGLEDLNFIVPHNVNLILVPKCENAKQILKIEDKIKEIFLKNKKEISKIYFMPIIESALGVENAFEIASSSENVVSLAIGLEDFTADLGVSRTKGARESFYARTRIVNACKAVGIQAIDSVFSDVADMKALEETVKVSRALGFEGMGCIHPRQIKVINENFAPKKDEIEKAKKIIIAFQEAEKKGLGVVSLGTKMIDPPVVKRAEKIISLAIKLKILNENWNIN